MQTKCNSDKAESDPKILKKNQNEQRTFLS